MRVSLFFSVSIDIFVVFALQYLQTVTTAEISTTNDSSPEYNCRNCVYVLSKNHKCVWAKTNPLQVQCQLSMKMLL